MLDDNASPFCKSSPTENSPHALRSSTYCNHFKSRGAKSKACMSITRTGNCSELLGRSCSCFPHLVICRNIKNITMRYDVCSSPASQFDSKLQIVCATHISSFLFSELDHLISISIARNVRNQVYECYRICDHLWSCFTNCLKIFQWGRCSEKWRFYWKEVVVLYIARAQFLYRTLISCHFLFENRALVDCT